MAPPDVMAITKGTISNRKSPAHAELGVFGSPSNTDNTHGVSPVRLLAAVWFVSDWLD
jgi:hypothetical protein